jgi:hypothetical protein
MEWMQVGDRMNLTHFDETYLVHSLLATHVAQEHEHSVVLTHVLYDLGFLTLG